MSECTTYMTKQDILDAIRDLSHSQGFYSQLLESLKNLEESNPKQYELYLEHLQQQHFKDPVDMMLYIEC